LPDYIKHFASELTVNVTQIHDFNNDTLTNTPMSALNIIDGQFKIYGRRSDIETEPSKDKYVLNGNGPYTWLSKR
jgi:hypothetical protein